ncbi:flagellar brake protein [Alteromonadaceae bacterium BrNp21-10]|nr:flagellar brake protein [Alteromonadaceae bacterium BrNp21-10]
MYDDLEVESVPQENIISHNVRMGQYVDVEIQTTLRDRFKSHLIGTKDGHYMVIEQPDSKKYGYIRDQLVDGQPLIVRTICEKTTGECLGFRTTVQGISNHPYKLLFISYPDDVQMRELRREKRKGFRIPAAIYLTQNGNHMKGIVTDISAGGCRFEFKVGETVRGIKQDHIYIELEHPETKDMVEVHSRVCSQRKELNVISIGLAFETHLQMAG